MVEWKEYRVRYDSVYFNGLASQVSFNYSGQKSDAGGYAQVYIDSKVGEPVATINLPVTGDNWSIIYYCKSAA